MTFADEINALMASTGKTQAQIAKDLNVSRQAVQFWAAGRSEPKGANLYKFRQYAAQNSITQKSTSFRLPCEGELVEGNWERVTLLDVDTSCGEAYFDESTNVIVSAIDFYKPFLHDLPGVASTHGNFKILHSTGDSMLPTIQRKAVCLIDTKQNRITTDAIYCIQADNNLFVKRVLRNFDGSITLISDNNKYPPQVVQRELLESAKVLGRVVFVLNADIL